MSGYSKRSLGELLLMLLSMLDLCNRCKLSGIIICSVNEDYILTARIHVNGIIVIIIGY